MSPAFVNPATLAGTVLDDGAPVLALLDRARAVDGFSAVNESGRLALTAGGGRLHVLVGPAAHPLGYGGVELPDLPTAGGGAEGEGGPEAVGAELVVDPAARRQGIGATLLEAVRRLAAAERPGSPVGVWAHEDTAAARGLATAAGMTATRTLLLLRRPPGPPPPVALPAGVRLAPFRPGVDEQAWLAVNAAAFASHPEQGRWTAADLAAREAEPWFDPAGFLLAWAHEGVRLLGFDWTKVPTGTGTRTGTAQPAIGEIYVLAVSPTAGVRGLGTALAAAGLAHLHDRGVDDVELYVEADNERALRLYHRVGFVEHSRDVRWTAAALEA